jgi:hypothetical protein
MGLVGNGIPGGGQHMAAQEGRHRLRIALGRYVLDRDILHGGQPFHGQMIGRTGPGGGILDLPRVLLGVLDKLFHGGEGGIGTYPEGIRAQHDLGEADEILPGKIPFIHHGRDHDAGSRCGVKGMAIGFSLQHIPGGRNAARARLIHNHNGLLVQESGRPRYQRATHHVRGPPGNIGDDKFQRFTGKVFRSQRLPAQPAGNQETQRQSQPFSIFHCPSFAVILLIGFIATRSGWSLKKEQMDDRVKKLSRQNCDPAEDSLQSHLISFP